VNPPQFHRTVRQLVTLPILLLVLMAGLMAWQILAAIGAQRQLDHSDRVSAQLDILQGHLIDQETGLRGFQLTHDPVMLAPWQAAAGPIQIEFGSLHNLVAFDPVQSDSLRQLRSRYAAWLNFANSVLSGSAPADPRLDRHGKDLMDAIRATTHGMLLHESTLREAQYLRARALQRREIVSLLASALLIGIFLALFTRHHVRAVSGSYQLSIDQITQRSEELFESQQWFQTTLESIGDAVIACDLHGGVSFMNAVAARLTGWTLAEAKGHPLVEIFRIVHETTRQPVDNPVEKVLRLRHVIGLANHTLLIGRDGREYVIDDSAAPIASGSGEIIGVVLVFRDVTEERRMESALIASEKLAVAGRLAASIAHEIHNPLDSVANLHFLIGDEADPAQRAEYLRLAQQELSRTMQISRTLLSLYREPRTPVRVDLGELIEGVLLLLDRRLQHQGIRVDAHPDGSLFVEGYPAELRQVFTNLIVNAMEAAGPKGRIRIRMEKADAGELDGAGAIVEVADSGPGISPDAASRIFQPFFTTKGADGTGLGLWVSMGIVQKHGGAIRLAESGDPGLRGACLRVFLPARTLAPPAPAIA